MAAASGGDLCSQALGRGRERVPFLPAVVLWQAGDEGQGAKAGSAGPTLPSQEPESLTEGSRLTLVSSVCSVLL